MIIAVETSTSYGSVAAVEQHKLRSEICLCAPQGHCESILPMLKRLLHEGEIDFSLADAFAVSLGPGSFTALRIGLSTAKALSFSSGKPLVGIGTLDAISYNVAGLSRYVCPIMNARRGEVFYSIYSDENGRQQKLMEYSVARPENATAQVSAFFQDASEGEVTFLGDGVEFCRELIRQQLGQRCLFPGQHLGIPRASSVGLLAQELFEQGKVEDVERVEPIYVRRSDAELRRQRA